MSSDNTSSLGEFLRQERERRGITIEQLASATKISVRLLHSLETDRYADLPAKPFIRGFVTSYARFIGLDAQEVLSRFDRFIDEKGHERPSREGGHSGYAFERRDGEQSRTILWLVMGGFVAIGGIAIAVIKPIHHHHGSHIDKLREAHTEATASPSPAAALVARASPSPSASASQSTPAPASAQASPRSSSSAPVASAPEATPSAAPEAKAEPSPQASTAETADEDAKPDPLNSGINLERSQIHYKTILKTAADIWVRYRADERPMMKFILRKGKVLVLRAENLIRLQVSNGGVVSLNYNGVKLKMPAPADSDTESQGPTTFIFPRDLAQKYADPFPGEKPLPLSVPPR